MTRASCTALVLGLGLIGLGACGDEEPKLLDTAAVEREVAAYLQSTFPAFTFGPVECPAEVEVKQGGTFTCTAPIEDESLPIRVTQEDANGVGITYVPLAAVVSMDAAEAQITGAVEPEFTGGVTVDCGPVAVRVFSPGSTFECQASDPLGTVRIVRVTVKDIAGGLDVALV